VPHDRYWGTTLTGGMKLPAEVGATESDSVLRIDVLVGQINVDLTTCQGCGCCAEGCPEGALVMVLDVEGVFSHPDVFDTEACIGCGACKARCPSGSISLLFSFENEEEDDSSGEQSPEDASHWA
jgi:ferredoxin